MFTKMRTHVGGSLAVLILLAATVQAQQPVFPGFPGGANPAVSGGGTSVYTPFNPLMNAVNPGNQYGSSLPNPFSPNPYYPPYGYQTDPVGSFLYGSSAVVGESGKFLMNREQAQIYHQMALQKQLETAKLTFDLNKYIKDNTPSFTDEQRKIAEETLKRILKNATPGEIWSGRALNLMLKDLKQQDLNKLSPELGKLPETTLRQLNIAFGPNGSLGILKDKGRFTWPVVLVDEELVPKDQRDAMQIQAEQLVTKAFNNSLDAKALKDLQANVDAVRAKLIAKVETIQASQYLDAKRFLDNFDEALLAVQVPTVPKAYLDYQTFIKPGRSLVELVAYMANQGISFAPASPGDEAAYEVLYTGMANLDLLFNTPLVASKKSP